MSQSTARTGPSGLVRPTTTSERTIAIAGAVQQGMRRAAQFENALDQLRDAYTATQHATLPGSVRFSIETALELAERAPELYEMPENVASRFRLVTLFLRDALTTIDEQAQR